MLFDDIIKIVEDGFKVLLCLVKFVVLDYYFGFKIFFVSFIYFFLVGLLLKEGMVKKNKKLVKILRGIVEKGSDYLLKGEVVEKIVEVVNNVEINFG